MITLVAPQKDWDEALHPRDAAGRFTNDGEGSDVNVEIPHPTPAAPPSHFEGKPADVGILSGKFERTAKEVIARLSARGTGAIEHGYIANRDGDIVADQEGLPPDERNLGSVRFSRDELGDSQNGAVYHSHPTNNGPGATDIDTAAFWNAKGIVAVNGDSTWVVERNGPSWPADFAKGATYQEWSDAGQWMAIHHSNETPEQLTDASNDPFNEHGKALRAEYTDRYMLELKERFGSAINVVHIKSSDVAPPDKNAPITEPAVIAKYGEPAQKARTITIPTLPFFATEEEGMAVRARLHAQFAAAKEFDESKHPRDSAGRFSESDEPGALAEAFASHIRGAYAAQLERAYRVMDENPSMVHQEMPFGSALMSPDGRFFGEATAPQDFMGKSHWELAQKLGFGGPGEDPLGKAMDAGFVRTRMHDSTVAGWGRQIDVEANDMEGVRRAAQGVGDNTPDTTTIYYDTKQGSGKGSVALLARGGEERHLGSYGRFMQSIGERALRLVGWRKDDDFEAKHPRDERGRFAPDLTDRSTIKTIREHLDTHHPAWRAEATLGSSYEQGYRIAKAELLGAHHEEHLAGGNTHEHRNERGRSKDFDEDKHPRDTHGRFTDATGGDLELSGGAAGRLAKFITSDRFHHGFSYSVYSRNVPKVGKVLSIHPEREQIVEPGHPVTGDMLKAYVAKNEDLLADKEKLAGGWLDHETGRVYLDVSHIVSTDEEARRLCEQYHQEAYFDLAKGEEVRVGARLKARTLPATKGSNGRGVGRDRAQDQRVPWDPASIAGREAVERLRAQKDMRAILEDDKLWAELRDYATRAALPVFTELYLGGQEAALKLARRAGYRFKDFDEEKNPDYKGTKDDKELENRLAQRAALDAARLVNDWWNRLDAVTRYEMAALLGPAAGEEAALDLGAVTEGVAALFGPERAQRIAVTETTRAMGQAATATYEELGIDGWEWRTAEDNLVCPICDDMEANNPYSIDDPFEPAHVNCRCWPVPLVGEDQKEFDEEKHPRDQAGRFAVVEGSEPFTDDAERKAGREAAHEYYSHYEKPEGANYFIPNPYVSKYAPPDDTTAKWIPVEVPWVGKAAEDPDFQRGVMERTGQWDSPRFEGEHGEQQRQLEAIEQGLEYAQSMRDLWSANPEAPQMMAFEETVAETLDLGPTHDPLYNDERAPDYSPGNYEKMLAEIEAYKQDDGKADAALAKNIYNQTQESLKAAGVKEVTLYRGLSWERDPSDFTRDVDPYIRPGNTPAWTKDVEAGDRLHITSEGLNALSSWSGSSEKADGFGRNRQYGMVIEMRVPAEKIFSTPQTGFGSSRESEWVVLSHDNDTAKVIKAGPINTVNGTWETPEETRRREEASAKMHELHLARAAAAAKARKLVVLDDAANADWLRDGGVKEFDESLHPRDAAGRFADVFSDVATQELAPFTEEEKRERAELALAAHRYENRDPAIDEATGEYQWVMDVAHNMVEQKGIDLALVADRDAHDRDTDFERYAQILAQGARDDWSNSTNDPTTIQFQYDAAKALGIDRAMSPIDPRDIISAQEQDAGLVAQGLKPEETAAEFEKKLDRDYQLKSDTARGRINGAMAKAIYDETQKSLADAGIKEVVLYRGLAWPVEGSEPKWAREAQAGDHMSLPAEGQTPLSSWSSSYYRATQFAQSTPNAVVLSMRVPAKEVFSTHLTGFGSQLEHEWVIKAADNDSVQVVNGFVPVARRDNPAILEIDKAEAVKSVRLKKISVDDQAQNRYWLSKSATKEFNPDQPRDEHGRWTSGGEAGGSVLTAREQAEALKYMDKEHITSRAVRARIQALLERASAENIAKGKDWYPAARRYADEIGKRFGLSTDTVAGVLAATSPQVHWAEVEPGQKGWAASNQDQAERVLGILNGDYGKTLTISMDDAAALYAMDKASDSKERVKEALDLTNYHGIDETKWGQDFTGTHDIRDIPSDVLAAMHPEANGLRESLTKAMEIARGKDIDNTLSGLKVRAFYNNITHPESTDVTIDGHEIHALFNNNDLPDKTYAMAINTPGKYEWFEDQVRREAAQHGLTPSQLQAITWLQWRDDHPFTERRAATAGKDLALDEADPNDPDLWPPEKFDAMVERDNAFRRRISAKEFDEEKHPRDAAGKFTITPFDAAEAEGRALNDTGDLGFARAQVMGERRQWAAQQIQGVYDHEEPPKYDSEKHMAAEKALKDAGYKVTDRPPGQKDEMYWADLTTPLFMYNGRDDTYYTPTPGMNIETHGQMARDAGYGMGEASTDGILRMLDDGWVRVNEVYDSTSGELQEVNATATNMHALATFADSYYTGDNNPSLYWDYFKPGEHFDARPALSGNDAMTTVAHFGKKEFDEALHPRDDHGRFADSAGGGAPDLMGGIRAVGVPGPTAEHIKNVEALFEHSVNELNIMAGPDGKQVTPEEVKASLVATAQDIITHSDVAVRIPAGLVDEVLEQGVMNQHATNSTGGLLNPEFRTNVENEAFGIPKDAKYAEFPVYGYLSNPVSEKQSNVSGYGDVRLVLKDEVKDRTTYTHGDSLGAIAEDTVQPAPLRHPDALAERQDLIQYTFKPDTPRPWDDPQNYTGNYWETQIHGGVKGEDIARIEYVLNPIEYADASHSIARLNDFDQQAKMAESRGIPVYVQLNPGDMERYASERMQHYEDVVRRELSKDPTR